MNLDTVTIVCIALMGILLFVLGANVSRNRALRGAGNQLPSDPSDKLLIAIRAHGNAAEYVPILVVLFLLVGARSPGWLAIPLIIAATLARLLHAYGMLTSPTLAAPTKAREIGASGTYLVGLGLAVAAITSL